jgi:NAD(P)-dependent dehydrogenase (short-subunit alcohol dehydrogenase family)
MGFVLFCSHPTPSSSLTFCLFVCTALCKQLTKDYGCHVFLGSRDPTKGATAVDDVKAHSGENTAVELVVIDVSNDASVKAAAEQLRGMGIQLDALVNNAGIGLKTSSDAEGVVNTNLYGVKRVTEAFLPLLKKDGHRARIVNTGSGAGPMYMEKQTEERQKVLCSKDVTWEQIEEIAKGGFETDPYQGYGTSKALLSSYTVLLAKENPTIACFCLSPGFVDTKMTAGFGASLTPAEGTKSMRYCLFDAPKELSGSYFGSDGERSPLHTLRNPGEPVFDGVYPWDK